MYDIVIKDGKIISGTGNPWHYGDVYIKNGKIAKVSHFSNKVKTQKVIHANDLYVVPGFIDGHSHSDLFILKQPFAEQKVMQGITTEIVGMDGMSVAPIKEKNVLDWKRHISGLDGNPNIEWKWQSFSDYLDVIDKVFPSINIGSYVGLGTLLFNTLGKETKLISDNEIKEIRKNIIHSMKAGARGVSTALAFAPDSYLMMNEIIELIKPIKEYDGIFNVHIRNESNNILQAIKEVIEISKKSRIPVIITHFKVMGKENWGLLQEAINMVEYARQEGIEITMEQYPYTAASTMLHVVVPPWYHSNNPETFIQTIQKDRELIKRDIKNRVDWENFPRNSGWENIYISSVESKNNKSFEGKSIIDIALLRGVSDYADVALDLLVEEKLAVGMIAYCISEEEIIDILKQSSVSIITDGLLGGKPHPRVYGSFPRIIGRYVRDKGVISLEEAIRKMTSLPAEKLRLKNKGIIAENYDADITIIDFTKIADMGTYENPMHFPLGIEWVLVNGEIVVKNGKHIHTRSGKTIRD